jgi:hypothetical protein
MFTRRVAVVGLGVVAVASMALTACSSSSTSSTSAPKQTATASAPATASAAAQKSPQDLLTAAIAQLKSAGFNFTQTQGDPAAGSGIKGPGSYDPSTKSAKEVQKGSEEGIKVELDATAVNGKLWLKLDAGAINQQLKLPTGKWMLTNPAKVDAGSSPFDFSGSSDVLDIAGLMTSVSNVTLSGSTLSGTVDLTAATGDNTPDSDDVSSAGAAAKTAPFSATLDAQGRLTALNVDVASKALAEAFTFADYGSPSTIGAPAAATVVTAPAALYSFLND